MAHKIQGKIIKALPLESGVSQRGTAWSRQEYILEYRQGDRIKTLAVSVLGDNIARLALREGLECTILVSIQSQEWNERWYTRVEAYAREDLLAQAQPQMQTQATHAPNGSRPMGTASSTPQPEDDLPF